MSDAVIVEAVRTPIGRAFKGALSEVDAFALARVAVGGLLLRGELPEAHIDDIVIAESMQGGGVIARHTAVTLGLERAPGLAVNRHCAAGLAAVQHAAASIIAGMDRVVIAGGTESLSTTPTMRKRGPGRQDQGAWMPESHPDTAEAPAFDMSITVGENTAREAGLTRRDVDEWAAYSHRQAVASMDAGWFDGEIVPVPVVVDGASTSYLDHDEQPRRDTGVEKLAELRVVHPEIPGATVTAGNAAGLNDGAAALLVVASDYAEAHGITPLARVRSWGVAALPPTRTGFAPVPAIQTALARGALSIDDVDLWEINEAFCAVPVAVTRELKIDPAFVNVNGSGCSLGHPIAATGARMIVTMLGEMRRRDVALGCVSMCAGGGMGSALVLERV
ncbi:thiolase family protein [Yinghuangia sp. YIM S09857]|uniref:thiolase family protein n=1 Tax=Yinghuangia sp. YIM S09857 TaxID=3436929 RepID=UPI003F52E5F4